MKQISLFFVALFFTVFSACTHQPVYPAAPVTGKDLTISTDSLKPEIPQFYTHQFEGKNISFFVVKIDHKVLAFLDACASCYPHKQGYRYENNAVTCRYCNMNFSLYKLEKGLGGCYPIKIEGRVDEGNYLIPLAQLESAKSRF